VNFSFWWPISACLRNHGPPTTTYFEHHKAVSIVSPTHYVFVRRIFEHSTGRISMAAHIAGALHVNILVQFAYLAID
jgi:hypothetical protein